MRRRRTAHHAIPATMAMPNTMLTGVKAAETARQLPATA
jgi:hypothetical protein